MDTNQYILIAEDDKFYSRFYNRRLKKLGFEVVLVGNGKEALEQARKRKPSLVLMDLIMPVKDGFDTLKEFKADSDLKNIPVIVLSNLGQDRDIELVMKLGAEEHIVKSDVPMLEVVKKIKTYLK